MFFAIVSRLLRLLGRRENTKNHDTYMRGEPDGSEVTSLQKIKKLKTRSKNDLLEHDVSTTYVDESDIDIFPVKEKEGRGETSGLFNSKLKSFSMNRLTCLLWSVSKKTKSFNDTISTLLSFFIFSEDKERDDSSFKESALSQIVRDQVMRGDVNVELSTLARMVKIVVASMNEGKYLITKLIQGINAMDAMNLNSLSYHTVWSEL